MVEAIIQTPPEMDVSLPLLAVARKTHHLVYFCGPTEGLVLRGGLPDTPGTYRKDWINVRCDDVWEILPKGSKVELVQK